MTTLTNYQLFLMMASMFIFGVLFAAVIEATIPDGPFRTHPGNTTLKIAIGALTGMCLITLVHHFC
jgi:uncharacterized membrane protein